MNPNLIQLHCKDTSVWINPKRGMTIEKLTYCNVDLIDYDEKRDKNGATYGIPILYPTPNRVDQNKFRFENREVVGVMHGVVRHKEFTMVETFQSEQESFVTAKLSFQAGTCNYEQFPYLSEFMITIQITSDSIMWKWEIINQDQISLPYSLALHPFWKKYEHTNYVVYADQFMKMDENKLPLGTYQKVEATDFDLKKLQATERIALDHVYETTSNHQATICHPNFGIQMQVYVGDSVKYCVVYTPSEKDWFCIEPQTSSTNCHNLYQLGYCKESNLQIVKSGERQGDFIKFVFSKE